MIKKFYLEDNKYPFKGIDNIRNVVRAIVINDENKIALHHIFCSDIFGERDYYETPGGGVEENEDLLSALKRELNEELGAKELIKIKHLAVVEDYYNLIKRKNINHYFVVKCSKFEDVKFTDNEKRLIDKTIWININDAIDLYKNTKRTNISSLVIDRELPILLLVKTIIDDF